MRNTLYMHSLGLLEVFSKQKKERSSTNSLNKETHHFLKSQHKRCQSTKKQYLTTILMLTQRHGNLGRLNNGCHQEDFFSHSFSFQQSIVLELNSSFKRLQTYQQ